MTDFGNVVVTGRLIRAAAVDYAHYVSTAQEIRVERDPADPNRLTVEIVPTPVEPFDAYFKRWVAGLSLDPFKVAD